MKLNLVQASTWLASSFGNMVKIIARQTKFVQRVSVLGGQVFLQALVFGFLEKPAATLNDLAQVCLDLGVAITPQGLDQRINETAVVFLKEMLAQAMEQFKNSLPLPLPIVQQFSAIYLTDSSVLSLPPNMAGEYPGCGGDGPGASLKVQLTFDFLLGNLTQVVFQPSREPDQKYQGYLAAIQPGSLSITDLGYFCLDAFKTIMLERKAHFLSRFLTNTGLLSSEGEPVDLYDLLQNHPRQTVELDVLLGKQAKYRLPCRLICLPAPPAVAEQRRRKARETARRKGRTPSKKHLAWMDWTLFITNVPASMLSIEQIVLMYRVRWQIELVFKLWKSYCGLKRIAGVRRERVLVELYAKMIGIVLVHFLIAPLRMPQGPQANREISPVAVREIVKRFARDLNRSLATDTSQAVLSEMLVHIQRFGFKEKRRKSPNVCHALALASAMCGLEIGSDEEALVDQLLT